MLCPYTFENRHHISKYILCIYYSLTIDIIENYIQVYFVHIHVLLTIGIIENYIQVYFVHILLTIIDINENDIQGCFVHIFIIKLISTFTSAHIIYIIYKQLNPTLFTYITMQPAHNLEYINCNSPA